MSWHLHAPTRLFGCANKVDGGRKLAGAERRNVGPREVRMPSASRPKSHAPGRVSAGSSKPAASPPEASAIMRIAHELTSWANSALGVAEGATEMTVAAAKSLARGPAEKAAIGKAGEFLRAAREAAGITVDELGTAVDLPDPTLIEEAEEGKAALPFDLVLRLAGVLGRNDPISFALKLTRSYNPGIWQALDDLGVGKLVVQAGRE